MKILLLEDDALVSRSLVRVLAIMGHEVVAASDVAGARLALGSHDDVDIVFADLGLKKGESGLDFLRWVEGVHPQLGRVLLTGLARPPAYADDPPRQGFLLKPFDQERLQSLLDKMSH